MSQAPAIPPSIEPVRKSVAVPLPVDRAFTLFTERIGQWWPLGKFSISERRAVDCAFEPCVGGLLFERRDDGECFPWGTVLVWEPPHRFVVTWHPGRDAATAQELEVRFIGGSDITRVELEHRGWEALGSDAHETRGGYENGWDTVLGLLLEAASTGAKPRRL